MRVTVSESVTRPASRREGGFSVLELMMVLVIVLIMSAIGIFSYSKAVKGTTPDIAGRQITDFLREGNERALMTTIPYRVDLTRSTPLATGTIKLIRTTDNVVVRQETLGRYTEINMRRPTSVAAKPPAPFDFDDASFNTSDVWSVVFHADGSASAVGASTPMSANIYFYPPLPSNSNDTDGAQSLRVVSLFGPTGAVRFWGYDGNQFIRR